MSRRGNGPAPRGTHLVAVVVVLAVLLPACRSGPSPSTAPNHPFAAYRQCLQQHGVTPRGRGANRGSTSSTSPGDAAAFAAARKACAKLRPAGGLRGGGIDAKARADFRRCMTDHGVTLPTRNTSETTGTTGTGTTEASVPRGGMLRGLDRNDPNVAKALAACRPLLVPSSTTSSTK